MEHFSLGGWTVVSENEGVWSSASPGTQMLSCAHARIIIWPQTSPEPVFGSGPVAFSSSSYNYYYFYYY